MALPTGVLRCAAAWILLVRCCYGFLAPRSQIQARLNHPDDAADLIPNHYIVHFHANHTLADHYANTGVNVSEVASLFVHWPLFNSYHFKLDRDNQTLVHDLIRRDPGVEWMSHNAALRWQTDQEVHHVSSVDLNHVGHTPGGSNSSSGRQLGKRWDKTHTQHAQWHISMTTMSKKMDFSGHDVYDPRPMWEAAWLEDAGQGVNIYIFDTGVNKEHAAFGGMKEEGRIWNFKSVSDDTIGPYTDEDQREKKSISAPIGHGSHVASIAAGRNGGALSSAFKATIVSVKTAGSGTTIARGMAAFNDVLEEHNHYINFPPDGWRGSVINVSMYWPGSNVDDLQRAVCKVAASGIPIAAAAGNHAQEALRVPAKFKCVYSVGAVDHEYRRWIKSHFSKRLRTHAPGVAVFGANAFDNTAWGIASGTSMASPNVAGIMAIMVGYEGHGNIDNAQKIYDRLDANAIDAVVVDGPMRQAGTTSKLAQSGINNPNRDRRHPYDGIPKDELKRSMPVHGRQSDRGDYWDAGYYDGLKDTVENNSPEPVFQGSISTDDDMDDDISDDISEDPNSPCDCQAR